MRVSQGWAGITCKMHLGCLWVALSEVSSLSPIPPGLSPSQAECSCGIIGREAEEGERLHDLFAAPGYLAWDETWVSQQRRLACGCSCASYASGVWDKKQSLPGKFNH